MLDNAILYEWTPAKMVEIELFQPDDFLKIKETLTRIGIGNAEKKQLTQSCHILHKQGKYYIVHFKELFRLDNRPSELTIGDVARRNKIISLLQTWGLLKVVSGSIDSQADMSSIKIIPYSEKSEWDLRSKYTLGKK